MGNLPFSEFLSLWRRCGIDEWHLECLAGAELDLDRSVAIPKDHDFIAAVRRKEGDGYEFFLSSSYKRAFESSESLNDYLRALGLEELNRK